MMPLTGVLHTRSHTLPRYRSCTSSNPALEEFTRLSRLRTLYNSWRASKQHMQGFALKRRSEERRHPGESRSEVQQEVEVPTGRVCRARVVFKMIVAAHTEVRGQARGQGGPLPPPHNYSCQPIHSSWTMTKTCLNGETESERTLKTRMKNCPQHKKRRPLLVIFQQDINFPLMRITSSRCLRPLQSFSERARVRERASENKSERASKRKGGSETHTHTHTRLPVGLGLLGSSTCHLCETMNPIHP